MGGRRGRSVESGVGGLDEKGRSRRKEVVGFERDNGSWMIMMLIIMLMLVKTVIIN